MIESILCPRNKKKYPANKNNFIVMFGISTGTPVGRGIEQFLDSFEPHSPKYISSSFAISFTGRKLMVDFFHSSEIIIRSFVKVMGF